MKPSTLAGLTMLGITTAMPIGYNLRASEDAERADAKAIVQEDLTTAKSDILELEALVARLRAKPTIIDSAELAIPSETEEPAKVAKTVAVINPNNKQKPIATPKPEPAAAPEDPIAARANLFGQEISNAFGAGGLGLTGIGEGGGGRAERHRDSFGFGQIGDLGFTGSSQSKPPELKPVPKAKPTAKKQ